MSFDSLLIQRNSGRERITRAKMVQMPRAEASHYQAEPQNGSENLRNRCYANGVLRTIESAHSTFFKDCGVLLRALRAPIDGI